MQGEVAWGSRGTLTGIFRGEQETRDGVHETKEKVGSGEPSHIDHRPAQRVLDHAVPHAHDEKQEEGEGVARSVENAHHNKQNLGAHVRAMSVLVV